MERNLLEGCRLISLSVRGDERGSLIPLERATGVPFDIARVYFIYERQVFAGAAEFLTEYRPDIVCEILPGADEACRSIEAMVRPLGYRTSPSKMMRSPNMRRSRRRPSCATG